jgi:hypothetical protein
MEKYRGRNFSIKRQRRGCVKLNAAFASAG